MGKKLITTTDVREAAQAGQLTLSTLAEGCIITPMAREEADRLGIALDIDDCACPSAGACTTPTNAPPSEKVIREVCDQLKTRLPAGNSMAKLETIVREVVYAKMGEGADLSAMKTSGDKGSGQGVRFIDHERLVKGDTVPVSTDEKMVVAEAIGAAAGDKLAGGYLIWEKTSFTRTVEQPEIAVIVEGELHLEADGQSLVGKPGDMLYLPKGAVVGYSAPDRVKLACVNCI